MTPLVTITRPAWRSLLAMALGYAREGGGLLLCRNTMRGNVVVEFVTGMTHIRANKEEVIYDEDEKVLARRAAHKMYRPLEPTGEWHTHPYPECNVQSLAPQISDPDIEEMIEHNIEIVVITYPDPGYKQKGNDYLIHRMIRGVVVRVEAWYKDGKLARPCEIRVR